MSNRVVPEAIVDLYFLIRLLLFSFNRVVVKVVVVEVAVVVIVVGL